MATPIEIIGIVLGGLPLVIQGIRECQRGTAKIKRAVFYHVPLQTLSRGLRLQTILFFDNVQKLLGAACPGQTFPSVKTANEWRALLVRETEERVIRYLGTTKHELFTELLKAVASTLMKVQGDLNRVNREGHIRKRLVYLMKEQTVKDLTAELAALNTEMDKLLANAATLHSLTEARLHPDEQRIVAFAVKMQQIRGYTDRLFDAFCSALMSDCHSSHDVALFLDTSDLYSREVASEVSDPLRFHIMLAPLSSYLWRETHVIVCKDETLIIPDLFSNSNDLCDVLMGIDQHRVRFALLLKDRKLLQQSFDARLMPHEYTRFPGIIGLEQVAQSIYPREQVNLAFKLATALLELKTSQWLDTEISQRGIYFETFVVEGHTPTIDKNRPLILRSFHNPMRGTPPERTPGDTFLELGILLLEIFNEMTFAYFSTHQHGINDIPPVARQGIADDWYKRTYKQMTIRYGGAIRACINLPILYNQVQQSWDDEGMWKFVCGNIICPLYDECRTFPI